MSEVTYTFFDGLPAPNRRQPTIRVVMNRVILSTFDLQQAGCISAVLGIRRMGWSVKLYAVAKDITVELMSDADATEFAGLLREELELVEMKNRERFEKFLKTGSQS